MIEAMMKVVGVIAMLVVMSIVLTFPIMWCWNAVVPFIWQLPEITWGKAWCLALLANVFFKSNISK